MRIGIDARLWSEAGNGRYVRNLIFNLIEIDKKNEYFIFLFRKDFQKNFPDNFHQVEADFRWYTVSEQIKFPNLLNKYKLDLVHFPHFNIPILYKGKFVVTIHDTTHQKFKMKRSTTKSGLVYMIKHRAYELAFKTAIKKSVRIITPTQYVKDELVGMWRVYKDKIVVTHEAAEDKFLKMSKEIKAKKIDDILKKFDVKIPFIFYIGNAHPHKNVEGLIKAFKILEEKNIDLKLVLSGKSSFFWQRVRNEFNDKRIIFTDFVTDEEYVAILKSASVYVQPSFEEGFGIPLLEAFAVGTPVVSSNAASLPEVGGDAAVYFDPKNTVDMSNKLDKVLSDKKLAEELVKKGKARVDKFSWKKMAEETLKCYSLIEK